MSLASLPKSLGSVFFLTGWLSQRYMLHGFRVPAAPAAPVPAALRGALAPPRGGRRLCRGPPGTSFSGGLACDHGVLRGGSLLLTTQPPLCPAPPGCPWQPDPRGSMHERLPQTTRRGRPNPAFTRAGTRRARWPRSGESPLSLEFDPMCVRLWN